MYGGNKPNRQQQQTAQHASLYRLRSPYQPELKDLVVRKEDKEKNILLPNDEVDDADVVNDIVKHNVNAVAELYDQSPPVKIYQSFVPNRVVFLGTDNFNRFDSEITKISFTPLHQNLIEQGIGMCQE